jgi:hypothetical protein
MQTERALVDQRQCSGARISGTYMAKIEDAWVERIEIASMRMLSKTGLRAVVKCAHQPP